MHFYRAAALITILCSFFVAASNSPLDTTIATSLPPLSEPAPAATVTAPPAPEKTAPDTAAQRNMRDSLMQVRAAYVEPLLRVPSTADSLMSPWSVPAWRLHTSDGFGLSEALRGAPLLVTIPFSLTNSLSRYLYMGYPAGRPAPWTEPAYLGISPSAVRGTDWLFPGELREVSVTPDGEVRLLPMDLPTVSPATFMRWENGVFDENTVRAQFARPISRSVSAGLAIGHRYLRGQAFTHQSGNVDGTYKGAVNDTTLVVNGGYNPKVDEYVVRTHVQWNGAVKARLTHTYLDLHNNTAIGTDTSFTWDTVHQYSHNVLLTVDSVRAGRALLHADLSAQSDVQHERIPLDARGLYVQRRRGEQTALDGGLVMRSSVFGSDTLVAGVRSTVLWKEFYHGREWTLSRSRIQIEYGRLFGDSARGLLAHAGVGQWLETINENYGAVFVYRALLTGRMGRHSLSLYARRDPIAYEPPMEPELTRYAIAGDFVDTYGGNVYLNWRLFTLFAAYAWSSGVDSSSLAHAWPRGMAPYQEPHSVVTLAPRFGRVAGFSLFARYMLSDTRPYHRIQGGLDWQRAFSDGKQLVTMEAYADYWSPREYLLYGRNEYWSRSLLDIYLKGSFQIRSFRFFMKVDNVLNRTIAYVPGYYMPGLTIRWGFNWFFLR